MVSDSGEIDSKAAKARLYMAIAQYAHPDLGKSLWQLADTFLPYFGLWGLMIFAVQAGYPYGVTLALAMVASILLVRVFIVFHDCCHGAFFASRRANRILGHLSGVLTFTPFEEWRYAHNIHHATAGDLDRRGLGDVWTMTVDEYQAAPRRTRLAYRVLRNPFVLFVLGPIFMFVVVQRFWHPGAKRRERFSAIGTSLALAVLVAVVSALIGLRTFLLIQLPILFGSGLLGLWLFYVQHQFEGVYWAHHASWDPLKAALEGSSYYKLPRILQWCTGNIGLHHIHHIQPRIPNYKLQQCYDETPALQRVAPLTFTGSLKSLSLNLWDEQQQKLVSFRSLRKLGQPDTP